ncbi:MAG: hypothetical protein LBH73_00575, partial [Spirochaetaceae bacterium]|nr:hypothetical protein [Spirochaetaceae bacterium]
MGIARNDAASSFYAGLRAEGQGNQVLAASLYEKALASSLGPVKEAARDKLVRFLTVSDPAFSADEKERSAKRILSLPDSEAMLACLARYTLGQYEDLAGPELAAGTELAASSWEKAVGFGAVFRRGGDGPGDDAFLSGLMDFVFAGTLDAPRVWLFEEWEECSDGFLPNAASALRGRLAVLRGDYGRAMNAFSTVLDEDPLLFLRYPALLGDLGRAFQYSNRQKEGVELFAQWADFLETGAGLGDGIFSIDERRARYVLFYFGGRIERQRQRFDEAAGLFSAALALAPDDEQADACIWYLLSLALNEP